MAEKQCGECGEMVGEAKAFCPSCGHAFVTEEKREEASVFDSMEGTMQFGQTMYNQMLSDMGLNLKEEVAKANLAATQAVAAPAVETLKPLAPERAATPAESVPAKKSNKFLIIGIIGAFAILLIVIAVIAGIALWMRAG